MGSLDRTCSAVCEQFSLQSSSLQVGLFGFGLVNIALDDLVGEKMTLEPSPKLIFPYDYYYLIIMITNYGAGFNHLDVSTF